MIDNSFDGFFADSKYVAFKNHLYNYLLRKRAVEKTMQGNIPGLVLEVGSGISPVMTRTRRIIYSDVSFSAMKALRQTLGRGWYVVADGMHLPFRTGIFSHTVSSEVLEHLKDDQGAINEMARVMRLGAHFIVTFPHKQFYFANDDRFVNHFRRYELNEMIDRLHRAGLHPVRIQKILGPLEKATMSFLVFCYAAIQKLNKKKKNMIVSKKPGVVAKGIVYLFKWVNLVYMVFAWLDAQIWPRWLSTILIINSIKTHKIGMPIPE